jgi:hypothetical protein
VHGFEDLSDGTVRLKCRAEYEARTFEAAGKATVDGIRGLQMQTTVAIGSTERGWSPAMFVPAVAEALPNFRLVSYRHASGTWVPSKIPMLSQSAMTAVHARTTREVR